MRAKTTAERCGPVRRLIRGYMANAGMYAPELAQRALQKEAGAVRRRLEKPETMTLGEYLRICRVLEIPIEEARNAIDYQIIQGR